ncbi:hypothetical protein KQI89_04340 [Clostridium sp. MSJ-4]|uniref:Bypass of forespore C C-terminal domain-containing protein n=1 Tax=Clostridium simiarum TaxID=2841506 RepID=A0ABS6EXM6_9CLOT|nr:MULTISPECIES: hypothetical protein [Clostridium]MBU5590983.1 hypothetical protein [Clostridium simiarum]
MQRKKNLLLFITGFFLVVTLFSIGYFLSVDKSQASKPSEGGNMTVYNSKDEAPLPDDLFLVLKEKDDLTGEIISHSAKTIKEFKGESKDIVTKKSLEELYAKEGYELDSFNDREIVWVKNVEKTFEPGKYYLGAEKGCIAIFKSDGKGKLFIEDKTKDITSRDVDSLPEGDKVLILNYELKFDAKEEAYDQLAEIQS